MNALLQRLQIDLPLFQGPMTGSDTPQLAAAVSQAGGLGFLAAACGRPRPCARPLPPCVRPPPSPSA